jgi:glycosyltransferase involved in cell wall biosynthesis
LPTVQAGEPLSVFALFRDSVQRREALAHPPGAPERYVLFGLDELAERGVRVSHNLEHEPPAWARTAGAAAQWTTRRLGGYGGDFASVLAARRRANAADVVLSTVDTVGIPLLALESLSLIRPPLVYVSIGLLPRLKPLEGRRAVHRYRRVLREAGAVVTYGSAEARELQDWLGGGRVVFIPFGVDTRKFRPTDRAPEVDVVSVGADPQRDFGLLLEVAHRNPERSFRIVASADHVRAMPAAPRNVEVETDLPLAAMRERLEAARVVALSVKENAYSGATTVLLQAMACGKPVVVSRTSAIAAGYHLADGENCRLVAPGDAPAFERALLDLLEDSEAAAALGARARETAERHLSWERYVATLHDLLSETALRHSRP